MKSNGFTLIELLVVISIISLLSSVVLSSLGNARASARDARRLRDANQIQTALEMYYNDNREYPNENTANTCAGGWECSQSDDGQFIDVLVDDGYLSNYIVDPVNNNETHYRYYKYNQGNYGCDEGNYYVLGIENMESSDRPHPDSPGWSCPSRNWQSEFDWVTGRYE